MHRNVRFVALTGVFLLMAMTGSILNGQVKTDSMLEHHTVSTYAAISSRSADDEVHVITIALNCSQSEFTLLKKWNEQFEKNNPNIKVRWMYRSEPLNYDQEANRFQLGNSADITLIPSEWVVEFASKGYLTHIDQEPLMNDEGLPFRIAVSKLKWNGYTWGVPKEIDPFVLVYNEPLLQAASIIPEELHTLDFIHRFHQMNYRPQEQRFGLWLQKDEPQGLISYYSLYYADWLQHKEQALGEVDALRSIDVEQEEAKDELFSWPEVFPKDTSAVSDIWESLRQGEIAMTVTSVTEYVGNKHPSIAAVPLWTNDSLPYMIFYGKSYVISSRTESRDEALLWIREMTNSDIQLQSMSAGGGLPVSESAYRQITEGTDEMEMAEIVQQLYFDTSQLTQGHPLWNEHLQTLTQSWETWMYGEGSGNEFFADLDLLLQSR